MRKLYLVRHAMPDFEDNIKLCIGRTDIDIGELGIRESESLRFFFADKNVDSIFSSPLSRCISTAKLISNGNKEIYIDEGLIEIDMGEWEGIALKDIQKNLGDEPIYGEKRMDALLRMENAIIRIMKKTQGDVICVSHAGVICAFIAKMTGRDIPTSRGIRLPYASYSCFEYEGEKFKSISIGQIPV